MEKLFYAKSPNPDLGSYPTEEAQIKKPFDTQSSTESLIGDDDNEEDEEDQIDQIEQLDQLDRIDQIDPIDSIVPIDHIETELDPLTQLNEFDRVTHLKRVDHSPGLDPLDSFGAMNRLADLSQPHQMTLDHFDSLAVFDSKALKHTDCTTDDLLMFHGLDNSSFYKSLEIIRRQKSDETFPGIYATTDLENIHVLDDVSFNSPNELGKSTADTEQNGTSQFAYRSGTNGKLPNTSQRFKNESNGNDSDRLQKHTHAHFQPEKRYPNTENFSSSDLNSSSPETSIADLINCQNWESSQYFKLEEQLASSSLYGADIGDAPSPIENRDTPRLSVSRPKSSEGLKAYYGLDCSPLSSEIDINEAQAPIPITANNVTFPLSLMPSKDISEATGRTNRRSLGGESPSLTQLHQYRFPPNGSSSSSKYGENTMESRIITVDMKPYLGAGNKRMDDMEWSNGPNLSPHSHYGPSKYQSTLNNDFSHRRARSVSKMPLSDLYARMGLGHDHAKAKQRESKIMDAVRALGFDVGRKTWIRDTPDDERKKILDKLCQQMEDFGYTRELLDIIVRRGTYARMQSRLRQQRRHKRRESSVNSVSTLV